MADENDKNATSSSKSRFALLAKSAAGGKWVKKASQKPSAKRIKVRDALRRAQKSD
jgi:hypothetical protein